MNRVSAIVIFALLIGFVAILLASPLPVRAQQDSSGFPSITIESYTYDGVTYQYAGGSIPVGATIDFRVWVDLYNIDPVKIGYGDGTSDSYSFNGAFSYDFYHAYQTADSYIVIAYMPTDSGTFDDGVPVTISSGSAPNGGGGSGGQTVFPDLAALPSTSLVAAAIGFVALIAAAMPASVGAGGIQEPAYPLGSDTVVLGDATAPQLLRSPEAEKEEQAKAHAKECANLKAVYDEELRKAKLYATFEEQCRSNIANLLNKAAMQYGKLPVPLTKDELKDYLKDKALDAAKELPLDFIMTMLGVEEENVLRKVCEKAAEILMSDNEPTMAQQLLQAFNGYIDIRNEAKRLNDLANFRLNEFKTQCPDFVS